MLALLLVTSSVISVGKQAFSTLDLELTKLKEEVLPNHLQSLAFQVSSEMKPLIASSQLMANDKFIESWVNNQADNSQLAIIEKSLQSIKAMIRSDFTFYTLETPNGTEYIQYSDKFSRVLLKDYQFKDFYPNFLATGKEYELNMENFNGEFVVFINYRSDAINPNTNKPYAVAGLGLKVDKLINMVRKLKIGENGRAMLVTEQGEIQAKGQDASVEVIEKHHIRELLADKKQLIIAEKEIAGETYYLGSLWVPTLDRFLIVEVPAKQITAPVYDQLVGSFAFILVFIVLSLIVLHFVVGTLTKPILAIGQDVHDIAEKLELDFTVKSTDKAEIGSLATAINSLLGTLRESLTTVNEAVVTTDNAVADLNQQANELHQAAESERQSVEQIFTATKDITEQSGQMTELALQAGELSHKGNTELKYASEEVQSSLTYLQELEADMTTGKASLDELNVHIEKILSVLEVITAISEQTNLLALNAAIEAARAGEHGRGFAVVADEVRLLSQRTSDSTGEIQLIISQLREASTEVTEQIGTACEKSVETLDGQKLVADKITELEEFLQQLFDMNEQIAERAGIQNASVSDINHNLEVLSAQSEQTSRQLELSQAAAEAIGSEMGNLQSRVNQFRGI